MIKKGSIVKCMDRIIDDGNKTVEKFPQKGCYYIVRDIVIKNRKRIGYRFEEIINPELEYGIGHSKVITECYFAVQHFVEISIDIDLEKFLKECFDKRK